MDTIQSCSNAQNVCIITGESGVGKSVIARQYAEKCVKSKRFKNVHLVNAADDKIEESIRSFACSMGLNIPDDNSKPLQLDEVFQEIYAVIDRRGRKDDTLLIFDDAEGKFLMKHYKYSKAFKSLVVTQCTDNDLSEFDENEIIHIDPYTDDEGFNAIKKFFVHNKLTVEDETLIHKLHQQLRGFPLTIYQCLTKIKIQVSYRKNMEEPIDTTIKEYLNLENECTKKEDSFDRVDDPHLRIISIIVTDSFQKLKQHDEKLGDLAEKLFLAMSFFDVDYLFAEMFANNKNYQSALNNLNEMGLFTLMSYFFRRDPCMMVTWCS